jgi:hypothetical protein
MSKNTQLGNLVNGIFVDSTGRVGVGNLSPTVALDVTGAGKFSGAITAGVLSKIGDVFIGGRSGTYASYSDGVFGDNLHIGATTTGGAVYINTALSRNLIINPVGGNVGIGTSSPTTAGGGYTGIDIRGTTGSSLILGSTTTPCGYIYASASFLSFETSSTIPILFNPGGTERMRITSGGNVGIGTTNPSGWALSLGTIASNGGLNISVGVPTLIANFNNSSNNPTNVRWGNFNGNFYDIANNPSDNSYTIDYNDNTRFTISSNGSIGAPSGTNIYNASDARLKKNISTTTYGLNAITALNPVIFNWVDGFEPSEDGKDMLGFVAQEVQKILPEAIESFGGNSITIGDTTINNPLRVNEKFIIPVLVKAIQELSAEINILKNK